LCRPVCHGALNLHPVLLVYNIISLDIFEIYFDVFSNCTVRTSLFDRKKKS